MPLHSRPLLRAALAAVCALAAPACSDRGGCATAPTIAVLGAFPGELAALLDRSQVEEEVALGDKVMRLGTLGGVRVVVGMTGIGLINARATTEAVIERFAPDGVVMAGVAGSPYRIGDVAVPEAWYLVDDRTHPVDPRWLELARDIARPGGVALEQCVEVPPELAAGPVCMPEPLALLVGGTGQSSDPFGGRPLVCSPDGHPVFGCDVGDSSGAAPAGFGPDAEHPAQDEYVAVDMESAAVARAAAAAGLRFIAFRAVSDGANDPLGLPGFPAQFFAYYPLAASNAAAAATAFLERLDASCP
ncbi:MAG: hypothetical protein AB1689_05695 [Thermodesulfobacteriota bacterium]